MGTGPGSGGDGAGSALEGGDGSGVLEVQGRGEGEEMASSHLWTGRRSKSHSFLFSGCLISGG